MIEDKLSTMIALRDRNKREEAPRSPEPTNISQWSCTSTTIIDIHSASNEIRYGNYFDETIIGFRREMRFYQHESGNLQLPDVCMRPYVN